MFLYLLFLCQLLQPATITGRAIKIVDGDTFDLLSSGTVYRIRLNGIDCPERGQPYYRQAKDALGAYCSNSVLTVRYKSRDRNGRLIGDVYVGKNYLNLLLLQQGLAWHFKKYSKDNQMAAVEVQARVGKRGLWFEQNTIAPWEWRKRNK